MKVKELERTVNVAWSPGSYHPILLAAGTAAQQLDASFSTTASLELYSLNLQEPGLDLELKCSVPSQNRFHKVVWGGGSQKGSAGVVVGGCDGGKIEMYNVSKILAGEDGLIQHKDRHSGPVRALDFNPFQTNLLASGASESEIFIWDLNNTSTPMTPGAKSQSFEDVMSLAWNRQVQHILASTFATRCIVWDLKKNEPIIKLTDSNSRVRWKGVAWNPDVATQLCLASEEDSNPVVQLWDLRFATTPLKSLQAHSRGVLSLAWCNQDSDLLISTGKDNRIICWNPNSNHPTGEIQCEIGNTQQWIFELSWCPRNPNLIASCSADSHASIYNLTGSPTQSQTSNKIADSFPGMEQQLSVDQPAAPVTQSTVELVKPPKWMRRPGGASFAFGGKLVSFGGEGGAVTVSQVTTDLEYVERARNVLELLNNGRAAELCTSRQDPLWSYLEAMFAPRPHGAIKNLLGYAEVIKNKEPDLDTLNNQMAGLGQEDPNSISNNIMDDPFSNHVNGTEAFDAIGANQDAAAAKKPLPSFHIPTNNNAEGMICKALLAGDLEDAVNSCLTEGRSSDALVLAMVAGATILDKTQKKYFDSQNGTSQAEHLIRAIVTNSWNDFIASCELVSWKEALVALLTYARQDEIPYLCEEFGRRLEEVGGEYALGADVCYITAGSIGSIIRKKIAEANISSTGNMQELVELVMVGEAAALSQGKQISTDGEISDLFNDYALVLASQGDYQTALSYLQHTQSDQVKDLRDRLHSGLGIKQDYQQQPSQTYQQNQGYQSHQNQNRKFSGPQQTSQFDKMTRIGAIRSNAAITTSPGYGTNDFSQPQPRPPSVPPPSHSPGPQHTGGMGKKYLVDPSVSGDGGGGWGNKYHSGGSNRRISQEMAPSPFPAQPSPYQAQPAPFQPPVGTFQPQTGPFQPPPLSQGAPQMHNPMGHPPSNTPTKQMFMSAQTNFVGKTGGWNDPPILSSTPKSQNKQEAAEPKVAITSPLAPPPPDAYGGMGMPGIPGGVPSASMRPPGPFQPHQRYNTPVPPPPMAGNAPPGGLYQRQMEPPPKMMGTPAPPPIGAPPSMGGPPPMGAPSYSMGAQPPIGAPPTMGALPPMGAPPPSMGAPPPSMGAAPPSMGAPPPSMGAPPPSMGAPPPSMGAPPPSMGAPNPLAASQPPLGAPPPTGTPSGPPAGLGGPSQHPTMSASHPASANSGPPVGVPGGPPQMGSIHPPLGATQLSKGATPPTTAPPLGSVPSPFPAPMGGPPSIPPSVPGMPSAVGQRPPSRPLTQTPNPLPPSPAVSNFQNLPPTSSPVSQMNGSYGDPPTPRHVAGPLPDNLKPLQSTLESLRAACFNSSNNPQVKRKLEDVARKLELLYEALRESKLSPETLSNLEEMVNQSREGNYTAALGLHTRMISGPDFSQLSSFMPALKVLIQTALQLNIYMQ